MYYGIKCGFSLISCAFFYLIRQCDMQGHWRNNFADGTGTLTYADGDKYVGHWKEGKKSDDGELYYTNGDKFRYV